MERLAHNGTWQAPTLVVLRSIASLDDSRFTDDPRVRYMPAGVLKSWDWRNDFRFRSRTPEDWAIAKRLYKRNVEILGAMHRAKVPILAGTDTLNPYAFPGFGLHDELSLLVDAGLSPADALRAATLNPAAFRNAADSGAVETGKRADLVLLDGNPLESIGNIRKIRAVVLNGRFYDRAALDGLLAAALRRAKSPR
jgi:imidazolonepropionase-like amidohydrolase